MISLFLIKFVYHPERGNERPKTAIKEIFPYGQDDKFANFPSQRICNPPAINVSIFICGN